MSLLCLFILRQDRLAIVRAFRKIVINLGLVGRGRPGAKTAVAALQLLGLSVFLAVALGVVAFAVLIVPILFHRAVGVLSIIVVHVAVVIKIPVERRYRNAVRATCPSSVRIRTAVVLTEIWSSNLLHLQSHQSRIQ